MFNKETNIQSGKNARHCLGQNAHARGRLTPQFFQLESCHKLAIIVAMDTSNSIYIYERHGNAANLLTNINRILGQYT